MPDTLPPRPPSQSKNRRTSLTYNGFSARVQDPEHHAPLSTAVASPAGVGDVLRPSDVMLYEQQLAERMDRGDPVTDEELDILEALRRGESLPAPPRQSEPESEQASQRQLKSKAELKSKLTSELFLNEVTTVGDATQATDDYEEYDYSYEEAEPSAVGTETEPEQISASPSDANTLYTQVRPTLPPWPSDVPWRAVRPLPAGDHYTERVLRTHRLPTDVAEALDSLEELCKANLRLRINLSDIVATAITLAIQEVADHGIHSPLLRTMLGPLYDQLACMQSDLTAELKSNLQTVLNTDLKSQLKSELKLAPLIDSNHPSRINLTNHERDDSSRLMDSTSILKPELKLKSPHQTERPANPKAPLQSRTEDLQRWQIFVTDFEREIPGNPPGNKPATASQLESIRQEAGVSVEEFAEAFYEARARYQRADKSKLRSPWGYLIAEIKKVLGTWDGSGASGSNNGIKD